MTHIAFGDYKLTKYIYILCNYIIYIELYCYICNKIFILYAHYFISKIKRVL
jgi:hypothetical protein